MSPSNLPCLVCLSLNFVGKRVDLLLTKHADVVLAKHTVNTPSQVVHDKGILKHRDNDQLTLLTGFTMSAM